MAGEQIAFRRAALGSPVSEYSRLVDRSRVNKGGKGIETEDSAATTASSLLGVTVTAHATINTKGTPVELIASTAYDTETVEVTVRQVSASGSTDTSTLIDIVTGASLTTVLIPDLLVGGIGATNPSPRKFIFPLHIPAGTRVGVQSQSALTACVHQVSVRLHRAGTHSEPGTSVVALGANQATSAGVTLTAPSVAHTKPSSFDEIATTAANFRFLVVALALPTGTSVVTNGDGLADIAIGAAASEVVIIGNIGFRTASDESINYTPPLFLSRPLPSGTRISARYQSAITTSGGRISAAAYGVA